MQAQLPLASTRPDADEDRFVLDLRPVTKCSLLRHEELRVLVSSNSAGAGAFATSRVTPFSTRSLFRESCGFAARSRTNVEIRLFTPTAPSPGDERAVPESRSGVPASTLRAAPRPTNLRPTNQTQVGETTKGPRRIVVGLPGEVRAARSSLADESPREGLVEWRTPSRKNLLARRPQPEDQPARLMELRRSPARRSTAPSRRREMERLGAQTRSRFGPT